MLDADFIIKGNTGEIAHEVFLIIKKKLSINSKLWWLWCLCLHNIVQFLDNFVASVNNAKSKTQIVHFIQTRRSFNVAYKIQFIRVYNSYIMPKRSTRNMKEKHVNYFGNCSFHKKRKRKELLCDACIRWSDHDLRVKRHSPMRLIM